MKQRRTQDVDMLNSKIPELTILYWTVEDIPEIGFEVTGEVGELWISVLLLALNKAPNRPLEFPGELAAEHEMTSENEPRKDAERLKRPSSSTAVCSSKSMPRKNSRAASAF